MFALLGLIVLGVVGVTIGAWMMRSAERAWAKLPTEEKLRRVARWRSVE